MNAAEPPQPRQGIAFLSALPLLFAATHCIQPGDAWLMAQHGHEQGCRERGNPHVPSPGLKFGCPPPFISLLSSKASAKSNSFPTKHHSSVGTSLMTIISQGKAQLCQGPASLEAAKSLTLLLPGVATCCLGDALNLPRRCCCDKCRNRIALQIEPRNHTNCTRHKWSEQRWHDGDAGRGTGVPQHPRHRELPLTHWLSVLCFFFFSSP